MSNKASPANNGVPLANNLTPQQREQAVQECNSSFRNTTLGKVVQFGSFLSFADNFWGTAKNWGETIATKGAYFKIMELAGQSVTPARDRSLI